MYLKIYFQTKVFLERQRIKKISLKVRSPKNMFNFVLCHSTY
jgi:hypothetical protein